MIGRLWYILALIVSVTALGVALLSYREVRAIEVNTPDALHAIAALLVAREAELKALQAPQFAEGSKGILESYLIRLRRDGAAGSAAMKQRIDRLAANTLALETLLDLSASRSSSVAFKTAAGNFRSYSIAWRDRWNSATELYMSGGNFPAAETPFPDLLNEAVQAELHASR